MIGVHYTGHFITFEGIDCSGKSTQAKLLYQRLCKDHVDVLLLRDPGTTKISERIRRLLLDKRNFNMSPWTELLLYEAARAQMIEESIMPKLKENKLVICDRFYDSTTAYQGYARQLDLMTVKEANKIGSCGVTPDITFYIDLIPELAIERRSSSPERIDRIESEGMDFQKNVRKGYLEIAKSEPNRIVIVKGNRTVKKIQAEIWHKFKEYYQRTK